MNLLIGEREKSYNKKRQIQIANFYVHCKGTPVYGEVSNCSLELLSYITPKNKTRNKLCFFYAVKYAFPYSVMQSIENLNETSTNFCRIFYFKLVLTFDKDISFFPHVYYKIYV